MGNARSVTAVLVATAAYLAVALAGCGRAAKTGTGGAAGPPAVGQAHTLTQAQIDAAIPPMPEFTGEDKAWADKLRGIYAGLSESKRQEMLTKDVCWFKLSDLPPEQAEVVKEFAKGQLVLLR